MSYRQTSHPLKNTFPLPNEIFLFGLCPGELAVYAFLLRCANRKTGQCWPSYKTIGKAVGLSTNTVRKHVCSLVDKGLVHTENTSVMTKTGMKRNGSLLYTLTPIRQVLEERNQALLAEMKLVSAQRKWSEKVSAIAPRYEPVEGYRA